MFQKSLELSDACLCGDTLRAGTARAPSPYRSSLDYINPVLIAVKISATIAA
jgi:hypothetical protein